MKTSLICLLLLAAVACAATQTGEMLIGEKRTGMAEKVLEMAMEKREEVKTAVAGAKSDGDAEGRNSCSGPCEGPDGEEGCCCDGPLDYYDKMHIIRDHYETCLCCYS